MADANNGCALDDECSSGVCQPTGVCALPEAVLYVALTGISAGECPASKPCELNYAKSKVSQARTTLHLADGKYELISEFSADAATSSLALVGSRGVFFQRATSGPVLQARDGATLTLRGITSTKGVACSNFAHLNVSRVSFEGAGSEKIPWINMTECSTAIITDSELHTSSSDGIHVEAGGDLTVIGTRISDSVTNGIYFAAQHLTITRTTIDGSGDLGIRASAQAISIHKSTISANHGGGISGTGGIFDITNNFILRNGNDTNGEFGGLRADTTLPGNRIIHNTIARNDSNPTANPLYAGGLFCRGGGSFSNNLIVNNFAGSATQPNAQVGGTCDLTGSLTAADDTPYHFVSTTFPPFDYHLADSASPAVNAGLIGPAPETEDFDGDPRNDGSPDLGADELKR